MSVTQHHEIQRGPGLIAAAIAELRGRPLACTVALFAVGIWAGAKWDVPGAWAVGLLFVWVVVTVVMMARRMRAAAPAILVLAALAGGFAYSLSQVKPAQDVCSFDGTARTLEGIIVSDPRLFGTAETMAVEIRDSLNSATGARAPARGRVWLTCEARKPFERGDLVRFTSVIYTARTPTNPGETSRGPMLDAAGLSALAYVRDERLMERMGAGRIGIVERAGIAFREHVSRILRDTMPGPYRDSLGALLGSIVFGAKANPLPQEVMEAFRRAGVVHILVVSGSQISLLFTIVYAPGALALYYRRRRYGGQTGRHGWVAPLPAQTTLGLVLALIALYAVFTEGGRPVARAAVMGAVVAVGLMLRRMPRVADYHALDFDRYTIVAVAALALLAVRPEALFDIGLQLSLGAVLGLVYLGPKIVRWLRPLPRWLAFTISATVAAQLAVLPLSAQHFQYVSPVGFVSNIFVIPAAGFLLASGIAVCILGSISAPLAALLNYVNAPLLLAAVRFTYLVANLPSASVRVNPLPAWAIVTYYAALLASAALLDRWHRRRSPVDDAPAA
jgi:competence protein ComEC